MDEDLYEMDSVLSQNIQHIRKELRLKILRLNESFLQIPKEDHKHVSSPITNLIYHLKNARNVILNSYSQATYGNVTITKQASIITLGDHTDYVKTLYETINELQKFVSELRPSDNLFSAKIEEIISLLKSVLFSKAISDYKDSTNSIKTAEFSENKISVTENSDDSEISKKNSNDAKPVPEEQVDTRPIVQVVLICNSQILINSKSQTTFGDVNMIHNSTIDEQNSVTVSVNTLKKSCSDINTALKSANYGNLTLEADEIVAAVESAVASKIASGNHENVNLIGSKPVFEETVYSKPNPKEYIDSFIVVGGMIVIALIIGYTIFRNKRSN